MAGINCQSGLWLGTLVLLGLFLAQAFGKNVPMALQEENGGELPQSQNDLASFEPLEFAQPSRFDDLGQMQRIYLENPFLWNLLARQAAISSAANSRKRAYKQCAFNAVSCFGRKK